MFWGGFYREGQSMRILSSIAVVIAISFLSTIAFSQEKQKVLLVSDIDDTIKISHVLESAKAAARAANLTATFTGMSQLYTLIQRDHQAKVVYLSNAPDEILGLDPIRVLHENFITYNKFPAGPVLLRAELADKNHKITQLRRLLKEENPQVMILIGDNGERDVEIYQQFVNENKANTSLKIVSYIHQVYGSKADNIFDQVVGTEYFSQIGKKLALGQIGFVTPVEIAIDLNSKNLLSQKSTAWMLSNIAPYIAREKRSGVLDFVGASAFPRWLNCSDFQWRWPIFREITGLVEKLKYECN